MKATTSKENAEKNRESSASNLFRRSGNMVSWPIKYTSWQRVK